MFFSPDKTPQDLANLGITTDNSSLQDKEYYKNIPQIQEAFKTETGSFDNNKFDKYYQSVLQSYNEADKEKLISTITDSYSYDPYDYLAPSNSKVEDVAPKIIQFANPERRSRGIINLHETSAPTMSLREVAQQNKVFNVETNKFEDWTPNDWSGLSALTRPTLVMAQWDEDGTHEVNGRIVSHKAGDYKFNEKGDPFYETLGARSLANKDILHISDTLTIDGSKWNKYDPFDSDGLDKSVGGTIVKTILKVAPAFIPYVGPVYKGLSATLELGKLLPVLYKSIESIATGDISTSKSAQTATNIQAWFSRFDDSLSDKGQQGFFNIENIGKLVGDSSMQLFQQRAISSIPMLLKKSGSQVSENAIKWGRGLSLTYMAGTSSTEAYDAFKQAGASDRVAGLGMISVMGAMFGLMNNDYFKDFWFKDSYLDKSKIRQVVKESAKQLSEKEFAAATLKQISTPKGAAKWVMEMQKSITNRISKIKPGDLVYDAINEGVEESIEEATTDMVKAFYSGLNTLGIVDNTKQYNFGITPEDMFSRYTTAFVGGTIGGAVFSLHNKFESRNNPLLSNVIKDGGDGFKEMIYLLRSGKEHQLRTELDKLYKKGKLASTNLSGTEFEFVKNGSENNIQYKAAELGNSQNDIVYKQINYYIDRINEVIKEEGLDISDEELQFISEQANITGRTIEQTRQDYLNLKKAINEKTITEQIIDSGLYSQLFEDWNNLTAEIIQTKVSIENLLAPGETESKTPKDIEEKLNAMRNNSEYQQLRLKLDDLRAKRNSIINGEKNDYYTGQLLFAASPQLVNNFVSGFGIHNFTRYKYHKDYELLTSDEKSKVDSEYLNYSKTQEKSRVLSAYNIFTQMQEMMISDINNVAKKIKDSSGVYLAQTTQYKLNYEANNKKLLETKDALNKALNNLPEGVTTNEEIEKLKSNIQLLEAYLDIIKNYKFGVLNPALSQSGQDLLMRPNWDNNNLTAFENYSKTYIDYLNYIKNNNLYLDLVDSDLASILQGYLSSNNLSDNTVVNWAFKIQKELNNRGIEVDIRDPFITDLSNSIVNFIGAIKNNNIKSAIDIYNDIKISDILDSAEMIGVNLEEFIDKILPFINGNPLINYLNTVRNLKAEINSSPAYDLIDAASKIANVNNWQILELIKSEEENFLNSKSVEDYIIRDKNALTRLRETIQIINAISSLLDASVEGGFNFRINSYRQQLEKELLPIIGVDSNINIVKELNRIATQLQTLIDISERNQSQKLREQKDIAINMRQKFLEILTSSNSLIKEKFSVEFNIDLDKIISELNIPLEVTEDNYQELEEAAIKLETAIFTHINNSNLTNNDIADKLISLFNPVDLISCKPTKLGKDPNTVVTDFDRLVYLTSIIATPSQNFYNELKKIISNNNFTNAPIFSQEYAVRVGYSQILNKRLFNSVISNVKHLAEKTSDDEYIQTKSILNNILTIYGGAGVGKTKGVALLLKQLIPNANIITSAPTKKQTDNLSKSIEHTGASLTKNELLEKILGRTIQNSDIKPISNVSITADIKTKVNSNNIFGDQDTKVLFIDEISWYNRIELELISKWAYQNNISIVALGDYKQNSSYIMYDNNRIDCGIEDTFVVKTPDLIAPLRPDNIAKYDNYNKLAETLDKVYEQYYKDPSISISTLNTFTKEYLSANKISFKYFEDDNTFGGEKFISENVVNKYIEKFKRLSDDVAIITDKPEKYNVLKDVKVVPLNSVQGDEFDYVIIDKNFGLDESGKGRGSYYKLKDLYTLSQRSKKGTVIVNSGLGDSYDSKLDTTSTGNIEIPQTQINEFKEWRNNLLNNIPSDEIVWESKEPEFPTTIQQSSSQEELLPNISTSTINEPSSKVPVEPIKTKDTTVFDNDDKTESEVQKILEPVKVENVKKENVTQPVILPDDIVSSGESYIEFIQNDLNGFYKTSEYSFQKYLEINNPDDIKKLTHLLRSYFVYGYYKSSNEKEQIISNIAKNQIPQLVRNINPKAINKIKDLINDDYKFLIIPYNQKGLLVARIGQVDIPLLITNPQLGEYFGDIEISSKLKYEHITDTESTVLVDPADFKSSELNTEKLFKAFNEPIILSASSAEFESLDQSQKDYVYKNNGNTFLLVSADPFISNENFRDFLEPIVIDNKITWTTQHNDSIAIIGINWVTDFETILKIAKTHSKNKHADSIINGNRAGQIIGLAYKVAPNIVISRVKNYFKSDNDMLRVKVGNDFISTIEAVDNVFEKYKGKTPDIIFGYIDSKRGFVSDLKGEWSINRIFEYRRDSDNFNQAQLNEISKLCNESDKFKQGIYGRDIRRGDINGIYRSTDLGNTYVTNIKRLIGNNFKIDGTKINSQGINSNNDFISKLNLQLAELGLDRVISDQSNIETTINSINTEILSSVTTPKFELLSFNGNDIVTTEINDFRYMISNNLKIPVEIINISNEKTSKFIPFYVSLQNQIVNYVIENKNNNWSIREFAILNEYKDLFNFLKNNTNLIKSNITISKYVNNLIDNIDSDINIVEDYWNIISNNNIYGELQQQIDKYLMSKLMNNEC